MSSPAAELHVVLGATGGAGRAVVTELVRRGKSVRAVSRSGGTFPSGVDTLRADCTNRAATISACEGATVVYHCLNVPYPQWDKVLPTFADNALAAADQADAALIVTDNLYMYGPTDGPMTETTPRQPVGPKGRLRLQLEEQFLNAHKNGHVPVALGRASDFYGPHAHSSTRDLVFEAALDGSTAAWLGSLDAPHTLSYLPDFARGLVTLGTHPRALGEIWHLPSNAPITGRAFIEQVYAAADQSPRMRAYGYWALSLAGLFDAEAWEAREVLYQFQEAFVMDTQKFDAAFGHSVTPYDDAIPDTLAWHRRQHA